MTFNPHRRPAPPLRPADLPVVVALLAVLYFLIEAFRARIPFPFDLEWIEGGMLVEALRLRDGYPLFVAPSADFIPSLYPPLYPWLLGLTGEPGYTGARSLSALVSLLAVLLAVVAVRGERLPWGAALGAGAMFVVCYEDAGTFFDVARPDALALFFAVAAVTLARRATVRCAALAGGALALAFMTKQNYALLGLPIAGWLLASGRPRPALAFTLSAAVPAGLQFTALVVLSGGWSWTYLIALPGGHPWVGERAWPGAPFELWSALRVSVTGAVAALLCQLPVRRRGLAGWLVAVTACVLLTGLWLASGGGLAAGRAVGALLAAAATAGLLWLARGHWDEGAAYWTAVASVAIGLAIASRAHFGSYTNALLPGLWVLSVGSALILGRLAQRRRGGGVAWVVAGLLCWQAYDGFWQRDAWIPTADERRDGERIVAVLERLNGTVFMPHAPWYPHLADKAPSYTITALWDLQHPRSPLREESRVLAQALADGHWDFVVTPLGSPFGNGLERYYEPVASLASENGRGLVTRVGYPIRFGTLWRFRGTSLPGVRVDRAE